jgi:hypothetical protein
LKQARLVIEGRKRFKGNPLQVTLLTYSRQKYLVPKEQFLGIIEFKSVSIAVMALETAVCASLISLIAADVTLGASLCTDCTMPDGVRPRVDRLVKSNCDLSTEANIVEEGRKYLQSV